MVLQAQFRSSSENRHQGKCRHTNSESQGTGRVPNVVKHFFHYFLKLHATDNNIATVDDDIRTLNLQDVKAGKNVQQLWKKNGLMQSRTHQRDAREPLWGGLQQVGM